MPQTFKGEPLQVAIQGQAVPLWAAMGNNAVSIPVLIYNQDPNNTVCCNYSSNCPSNPNSPNVVPIQPLTSVTMDGSRTIWGNAPSGTMPVLVIPGATQFTTTAIVQAINNSAQALANAIASTGVPPVTKETSLLNITSQSILTGTTYTSGFLSVPTPGYTIAIAAGGGSTIPFVEFTLEWVDSSGVIIVATDTWLIPLSNGVIGWSVTGSGPTKGPICIVKIKNLDSVTVGLNVKFSGNSRTYSVDDWRFNNILNAGLNVAGFTSADIPADESILGIIDSVTIGPGTSSSKYLFSMFNGPATFYYTTGGGVTGPNQLLSIGMAGGNTYYGTVDPQLFFQSSPPQILALDCPRGPMFVQVQNNGAVNLTFTVLAVANPR